MKYAISLIRAGGKDEQTVAFVALAAWAGGKDMPLSFLLSLLGGTLSACYAEHQIHAIDALERRERREEGKR